MKSKFIRVIFLFLAVFLTSAVFGQNLSVIRPGGGGFTLRDGSLSLYLIPKTLFEAGSESGGTTGRYRLIDYSIPHGGYNTFYAIGTYKVSKEGKIELSEHEIDKNKFYSKSKNLVPSPGTATLGEFKPLVLTPLVHIYETRIEILGLDRTFCWTEVAAFSGDIPLQQYWESSGYRWFTTDNTRVRSGPGTGFEYNKYIITNPKNNNKIETLPYLPVRREVIVLARTLKEYEIEEWYANWYFVRIPLKPNESGPGFGWVYGALIDRFDVDGT